MDTICGGMTHIDAAGWADSRDLAASFGRRHHNVLSAIDLALAGCPEAAPHFRFERHPVTAGLGGRRAVRHMLVDRHGFMLLAMAMPSTQRQNAFRWASAFIAATESRGSL